MVTINYAEYEELTGGPPPRNKRSLWIFNDYDGWMFRRYGYYRESKDFACAKYAMDKLTDYGQLFVSELER